MKKLFSIIMCCTLTFMMSFTAFAAENASSNVGQKIVVNEYDLAKQLANKSVKTLSQNGYLKMVTVRMKSEILKTIKMFIVSILKS